MPQSSNTAFSGIFVSYRRDDSSGHAGRLFDHLALQFGKDRIFMDIDTIEPGEDFVEVIKDAVGSCEILLAIIGRHWLASTSETTTSFDNPNDFVRLEIATALERDIRVIPVLVQRASMPRSQDLPEDLAQLSRRNAVELSDLRWQNDVNQLISVMERILTQREEARRTAEQEEEAERQRQEGEIREQDKARKREAGETAGLEAERRKRDADEREIQRRSEAALFRNPSVDVGSGPVRSAGSKRAFIIAAGISLVVLLASLGVWLKFGAHSTGQRSSANVSPSPDLSSRPIPSASLPANTDSPVSSPGNAGGTPSPKPTSTPKPTVDIGAAERQRCALAALEGRPCPKP